MRFFWIWVGFSWFILLFVLNWLNFLGYTLFLMFIVATYSDQVASSASFLFFFDTVNLNWLAILVVRYSLCCVMMAFADSCCCSFFFCEDVPRELATAILPGRAWLRNERQVPGVPGGSARIDHVDVEAVHSINERVKGSLSGQPPHPHLKKKDARNAKKRLSRGIIAVTCRILMMSVFRWVVALTEFFFFLERTGFWYPRTVQKHGRRPWKKRLHWWLITVTCGILMIRGGWVKEIPRGRPWEKKNLFAEHPPKKGRVFSPFFSPFFPFFCFAVLVCVCVCVCVSVWTLLVRRFHRAKKCCPCRCSFSFSFLFIFILILFVLAKRMQGHVERENERRGTRIFANFQKKREVASVPSLSVRNALWFCYPLNEGCFLCWKKYSCPIFGLLFEGQELCLIFNSMNETRWF